MKFTCLFLTVLASSAVTMASAQDTTPPATDSSLKTTTPATQQTHNWWEFGLADPVLDEVALYYLGQSWHRSADVADVLETIYRTNNTDPWSWTMEWRKTAQRMEHLAQESLDGGHDLTASQAYLRASTYYRASLHRHPDPFATEVATITQQAVNAFEQFLKLSKYPCEPVRIPYQDGITLPGYLCITAPDTMKGE